MPKRLICVGALLGFYKPEFFPTGGPPMLIEPLLEAGLAGRFTTISGLDHKGPLARGHDYVHTFFTGSITPAISLDQFVAPVLGASTRYESLQICAGESHSMPSLSFSAGGLAMPPVIRPSVLFGQIFGAGSASKAQQSYLIDSGRSLLDGLCAEARSMQLQASAADQARLEHYLTSIRELEARLQRRGDWLERAYPTPPADLVLPELDVVDGSMLLENEDLMWDLCTLAIQNDTTRVISFTIPITFRTLLLEGQLMQQGYHALSHHGQDPDKIAGLLAIERRHMRGFARFLSALEATPDGDAGSLLDSSIVILGSAMGDASTHTRRNYPLLVAGGGLRHRGHLDCETASVKREMACDLYVTVLERLGFESEQFGSSLSNLNAELL